MKALKVILILIFSFTTLNLYSVNTCKTIEKQKVEKKISIYEKSIKDCIKKMPLKPELNKKISNIVLISIALFAVSIIFPIVLIGVGFMAPLPVLWLFLLNISCFLSIFGGVLLFKKNRDKFDNFIASALAPLSVVAGLISYSAFCFLALLTLLFWGEI